jgi:hypothetical protein
MLYIYNQAVGTELQWRFGQLGQQAASGKIHEE